MKLKPANECYSVGDKVIRTKVGKYTVDLVEGFVEVWYYKAQRHREDGPAEKDRRYPMDASYYLNDKSYSKKNWEAEIRKRKLKALGI